MRRRSFFSTFSGGLTSLAAMAALGCGGSVASGDTTDTNPIVTSDGGDESIVQTDSGLPPDDTAPVDTGFDDGIDHGAPSSVYPAFPPDLPQLVDNGGSTLRNPVIVTVTFTGDPESAKLEAFGDAIGGSAYWRATTAEYGIGPATSGASNHVRVPGTPPATMSQRDLRNFVASNAGVGGWPAPTAGTIYIVYTAPSTKVTTFGGADICSTGVAGYHSSTNVGGRSVSYAIVPACIGAGSRVDTASHELGEAATDPFQSSPGWVHFDEPHFAWTLWQQFYDENGDACEFYLDSFYKETESGFAYDVQRMWSNASAKAGHAPCVPAPSEAYFNTTPLGLEDVTIDLSSVGGPSSLRTKGYKVAVGETRTLALGLWSDAAHAPWSLRVGEGNPTLGPTKPAHVHVSIDRKTGENGEKAYVTVSVLSQGTYGSELIDVQSYVFGVRVHDMPIIISQR